MQTQIPCRGAYSLFLPRYIRACQTLNLPPPHLHQANNKLEAAARGEAAAAKAAETARHTAEAASEELAKLKAASGGHARDLATAVAAKEEATKSLSAANAKVRVCAGHGVRLHSPRLSSPYHVLHPLVYYGRRRLGEVTV